LVTKIGKEIYRLRKCTVEPVIGISRKFWGFASFLRALKNVAGDGVGLPRFQSETDALTLVAQELY